MIDSCLKWDPKKRKTAKQLCSDAFFLGCSTACKSLEKVHVLILKNQISKKAEVVPSNESNKKQTLDLWIDSNFEENHPVSSKATDTKVKSTKQVFPFSANCEKLFTDSSLKEKANYLHQLSPLSTLVAQTPTFARIGFISNSDKSSYSDNCRQHKLPFSSFSLKNNFKSANSQTSNILDCSYSSTTSTPNRTKKGRLLRLPTTKFNATSRSVIKPHYNFKAQPKRNESNIYKNKSCRQRPISQNFQNDIELLVSEDNSRASLSSIDSTLQCVEEIIQNLDTSISPVSKEDLTENKSNRTNNEGPSTEIAALDSAVKSTEATQESLSYDQMISRLDFYLNSH